uniref:G protein pathway suppressor 2 n=1 Tax=Myotis myotis TaxID=51298 RepID=A0A7J7YE76_MYOMY|nr:hypothetical protein mMyoMyo1_011179 [Myotis myotis]
MELEHKQQEKEEMDKVRKEKMKEAQERRKKKEMEERLSLAETKERIRKLQEELWALQEETHLLFLQLKKVVDEEEKVIDEEAKRAEWSDHSDLSCRHTGTHFLSVQGRPGTLSCPAGTLMALMEPNRCPHSKCLPPGILWTQRLSQGTQSTGNANAAQAVPMGLLSSHLTLDPLNNPIDLVSCSERLQHFL